MGDSNSFDDIKNTVKDISDTASTAIGIASKVISAFSVIGSASSVVDLVSKVFNLGGGENQEIKNKLNEIDSKLNKINKELQALSESEKAGLIMSSWSDITANIKDAITVSEDLIDPDHMPMSSDAAFTTCQEALEGFYDPDLNKNLWRSVYIDQIFYRDDWSGDLVPNEDGLFVFTYTYVLPIFMKMIYIYLSGRAIFKWNEKSSSIDEEILANTSNKLHDVHDNILSNIVSIRKPEEDDLWIGLGGGGYRSYDDHESRGFEAAWSGDTELYGAVEKYSAYSSVNKYLTLSLPWSGPPPSKVWTLGVLKKLNLRILNKRKKVYNQIGLHHVWDVINTLKLIIGEQPSTKCFGDWSCKEAFRELDDEEYREAWRIYDPPAFDQPDDDFNYPLKVWSISKLASYLSNGNYSIPGENLNLSLREMLFAEPNRP